MININLLVKGMKMRVVKNTASHDIKTGTIVTYKTYDGVNIRVNENTKYFNVIDLQLISNSRETIKDLIRDKEKEVNEIFEEICNLKTKIEYLDESGFNICEEKEYQIYNLLKNLSSDEEEKRKLVSNLFKK